MSTIRLSKNLSKNLEASVAIPRHPPHCKLITPHMAGVCYILYKTYITHMLVVVLGVITLRTPRNMGSKSAPPGVFFWWAWRLGKFHVGVAAGPALIDRMKVPTSFFNKIRAFFAKCLRCKSVPVVPLYDDGGNAWLSRAVSAIQNVACRLSYC
jgi:hypothetical protein